MKSFEHEYLYDMPISHGLVSSMRLLGEFRGREGLYTRQSPEVLETLRRAAIVQSVESSNRIEGVTVAEGRIDPLVLRRATPRDRSEQEVAGYRDALARIHADASGMKLSLALIRGFHRDLYRYTKEKAGRWKARDNAILETRAEGGTAVRFRPVSAVGTPKFMARLIDLYAGELAAGKADPLFLASAFVLDFECIHPFTDGNGRVGRLLTLLLLYQCGFGVGRYISLERIVEQSRETYYEALYRSSQHWHEGRHDLRPWVEYFLGVLIAAYNDFEARVGTISSAKGAKRVLVKNAIAHLPPRFTIGELERVCKGISRRTLVRALEDLRGAGGVRCLGRGPDAEWERTGR
ncbi:MAG: cell filamentation protein Fic [Acidobacteria bacterium RIFCSPLOWO2_02_FULL_65_29]|nr:MAG: cell filamentation protein Fic [Acidobacteria bacterium RIFCSPLOWO2_02_FULL_65_29]